MMNNKKPVFLYVVIAALTLSLAALGVLSFVSLERLASLQEKVTELTGTVEGISNSASNLVAQSQKLDELKKEEAEMRAAQQDAAQTPAENESQAEGTLAPSNGETFTDNTDASMDQLLAQVKELLPKDNGTWAVYVCNLLKGSEGNVNSTPMQAAALIKLFIMGTVYENYDLLSGQYGGETLDAKLHAMITVSDNDAANTLVNWAGGGSDAAGMEQVNAFCQAHGFQDTHMGRMLLQSNENGDNITSVRDCGRFLKEIYELNNGMPTQSTLVRPESMYYLLKMQERRNKIPAQMPEGIHVANKTGELSNVENDAGIVFDTAKGADLVICFMSQGLGNTEAAQQSIASISRGIYGYYNEY